MCLAYAEPEFDRFRRLGLNVMIPDYLGYGMSGGKASEVGCRETAEAAYQALRDRGFPAARIIAGGWSLGGAVAIDLASRQQVGGLIAFSTFTSTHDMARSIVPVPLPRFFFVHKFDSLNKLPRITCPILLGHGRRDTLVPFPMCDRLARAVEGAALQGDRRRSRAQRLLRRRRQADRRGDPAILGTPCTLTPHRRGAKCPSDGTVRGPQARWEGPAALWNTHAPMISRQGN